MESSLHRQLKERYGSAAGGRVEVLLERFRIDAIAADGSLIEVQSGALGPLRAKLAKLLNTHRVRVIKPVVIRRRLIRRAPHDGTEVSARLSPRRGTLLDVFDDLVGIAPLLPHPNLDVDLLAVEIDEIRAWRSHGSRRERVLDRRLKSVIATVPLGGGTDLWALLPEAVPDPFTAHDLARLLGRPLGFAQRVAYCLRRAGAAAITGKRGRSRLYVKRSDGL
jgi:hypothetical protein